jgi:hypothetical protein
MPTPKRRNDDVAQLKPFRDANKYAINTDNGRLYVVYSYRDTWPILAYDRATLTWYENKDRYSRTTSRHVTMCHPLVPTEKLSVQELLNMLASTKHLIAMIDNLTQDRLEDVPC